MGFSKVPRATWSRVHRVFVQGTISTGIRGVKKPVTRQANLISLEHLEVQSGLIIIDIPTSPASPPSNKEFHSPLTTYNTNLRQATSAIKHYYPFWHTFRATLHYHGTRLRCHAAGAGAARSRRQADSQASCPRLSSMPRS